MGRVSHGSPSAGRTGPRHSSATSVLHEVTDAKRDSRSEGEGFSEGDGGAAEVDSDVEALQEQAADVPFEVLQKARSDGRPSLTSRSVTVNAKRANKNRPMEVTSKKAVPRFREVIEAPKKVLCDPRFESLCGVFDESKFKQSYSFLYDEELPAERRRLRNILEKKKGSEDVEELEKNLAWIDRQIKDEALRRDRAARESEKRTKEKEAVKKGKRPFFPKKSDLRKEQLTEKYKSLKESGKLDAFLAKRRKKNASKDHRYMPYRRPQET